MNEVTCGHWLAKVAKLKVARQVTSAPHEPLLFLCDHRAGEELSLARDGTYNDAGRCRVFLGQSDSRKVFRFWSCSRSYRESMRFVVVATQDRGVG